MTTHASGKRLAMGRSIIQPLGRSVWRLGGVFGWGRAAPLCVAYGAELGETAGYFATMVTVDRYVPVLPTAVECGPTRDGGPEYTANGVGTAALIASGEPPADLARRWSCSRPRRTTWGEIGGGGWVSTAVVDRRW